MRMVRPLVFSLGLLGSAAMAPALLVPTAAHAQATPAFRAPGLVEIVPAGDVIGDGNSPVTMHVVALGTDGQPMTGLKLKPTATLGTVEGWTETEAGVYAFQYTAPSVVQPTSVTLEVKGRNAARVALSARYKVPVRPAASTGMSVVSNPPQLVLGQDTEGSISFILQAAAGIVSAEDLVVRSSVGEIQNLTHLGDGRFTARFVTPRVNYPQLAILTAADLRDPDRVFGAVAIPLLGKTDYPLQANPGSSVVLRIGGREYGPVKANAAGRAAVPVIVPPGIEAATKVEVRSGQTLEDEIDLRVPETRRISVMPTRRGVPADGTTDVLVRVAAFTPTGQPDTTAVVTFAATAGNVSPARHVGNGIYEARFTPRFSNIATAAKVTASLSGSSVQTDTMEIKLVPARPQTVTLKAQPDLLAKEATALRVFAKVLGANGQGLDRRELVLSVAGATVRDGVQDLRNGDYRIDFNADGQTNVDLVATVRNPVTGNPLKHVLLFPQTDVAPNDGRTGTRINVVTVDEFGFPVPGTDVQLQIETGDGSIQPSVKTNEGGVGQVYYTSGRGSGMVRIRARSGNRTGIVSLVQGPASAAGASVPASGSAQSIALSQAWEGLVVPLRVPREGAVEGSVGPTDVAGSATGALARIAVRPEPSTAAAGGRVTLLIDGKDAAGLGVAGLPFEVIASVGRASPVSDLGGGAYKATVDIPPDAVGELKVSVGSGDIASFTKIPISGRVAGGEGWGDTDGVASGDPVVAPPVEGGSTPAQEAEDLLNYRIRAAFLTSGYTYQQTPLEGNGPLLPATIAVGGAQGGSPALPQGGELGVRGFYHRYLGVDVGFRFSSWSLTADEFGGASAPDTIFDLNADLIGRFPVEVGDDHFWVGARVGYAGSDILYFTGSFTDDQINYQSLYVQGLGLGGEIGGEIGDLYVTGAIGGRMVGASQWLGLGVDAHVGYDITEQLFVDFGFGYNNRSVTVLGETSGAELGELTDAQTSGRFGVGIKL